ncbi:MAG: M15 family metallopeptidase [Clostridia bacterium]|nr:M15 family metallopeptidase [Clostridia bacterium]
MLESGFVYLDEYVPGIRWDAKYASSDNFTGRPVNGYGANRVVIHEKAAEAVKKAQEIFLKDGFCILAYDAYRPVRAVEDFLSWMKEPEDNRRKKRHYPNIDKKDMLALGYVAGKSGHSRGSTIDLTLVRKDTGEELDMGGIFDLMDEKSHTKSTEITQKQLENRLYLRKVMLDCGFTDYECEWWHFRLIDEPYTDTYFDFVIE